MTYLQGLYKTIDCKDIFEDADDSQEDPEMKQRMYKINMVRKFRYGLNWILKSKDHLWNITEKKTASFIKSELSWQVLIEEFFVHQLTFGVLEHILGSLKFSVFQAIGISTVGKAWDYNRRATKVLGSEVQSLLGVTFLVNLFCSNTILAALPEWSILGKPRLYLSS